MEPTQEKGDFQAIEAHSHQSCAKPLLQTEDNPENLTSCFIILEFGPARASKLPPEHKITLLTAAAPVGSDGRGTQHVPVKIHGKAGVKG